ncbi:hypothetical protein BJV74DRAFT_825483 [Russula compacta]|nr:hypothetical protein BJV74DRAFT_825483 [Russula compacta]
MMAVNLMALMPVMMKEAALTSMKAKVGYYYYCDNIGFDPHFDLRGEDWDELERKAAKSDKKRGEAGHSKDDDSDNSDRPKKKAPAKSKSQSKPAANGKGKR